MWNGTFLHPFHERRQHIHRIQRGLAARHNVRTVVTSGPRRIRNSHLQAGWTIGQILDRARPCADYFGPWLKPAHDWMPAIRPDGQESSP
jgi:hypothetical protein